MGLSDLFVRFYDKVFVGLYAHSDFLHVGVVRLGSDGETEKEHHVFMDGLNEEVMGFLQEQVALSPYNYVAVLTDSERCGALPTCSLSKAKEMAPAVGRSRTVCIDEEWMNYCDEELLYRLQEQYAPVQPDAIYSPFALLHAYFEEEMAGKHAMYLLVTPEALSMAVVKESHLRYAEQFGGSGGVIVPVMVEKIVASLEIYYGKPCCRGEFIEAVHIVDGAGVGKMLSRMLDELLLTEIHLQEANTALLCAQTCMKENGYGL